MLSNIMALIADTKWAISPATLDAIVSIVQRESHATFEHFHQVKKDAYVGDLGNRITGTFFSSKLGSTGIIVLDGPILPRAGVLKGMSGPELASYERLSQDLDILENDDSINTILFVLDSPGGAISGVHEFGEMIKKSKKKTQAYVMGNAASAAYWIASSTSEIYSAPTGESGSIGTVATIRDYREADKKSGVKTIEIVSAVSPYKRRDYDTDEGKAAVQKIVDQLGEIFVATVAENRKVSRDHVLAHFGQGDMLVAEDALKAGMIDGIMSLRDLLSKNNLTHTTPKGSLSMTVEEFKKENSEGYAQIIALGAAQERERLSAIDAITHPGAKDLVAAAKADPNGSAADVKSKFADLVLTGKIALSPASPVSASDKSESHIDAARKLGKLASQVPSGESKTSASEDDTLALIEAAAQAGSKRTR